MPRSGARGRDTGCGRHSSPPLGWRGHAHTWWPCPGQQSDSWSCFRRAARILSWSALFKTVSSDELVMMCGAQRAHQCSGSVAHDALPPSLRWQASFQRVPHGQAAGMRCRRQAPVQLADAKLVEALLKPAVRAANHIGEGGRTHRDDQRSEQQRWHNLMSKVPIRRAGHGQEGARRRAARAQKALPSQDLLRAIAHRHRPDD